MERCDMVKADNYAQKLVAASVILADLAEALETEVVDTACTHCGLLRHDPIDKSRALDVINGMIEKLHRLRGQDWAKTILPSKSGPR